MLAAIKSFFRFLKAEGCVVHDPAAALEYARQPKSQPRNVLTAAEATHLVQNHANLRHVQGLLGHGSLSTTEKYLRLTITDLKKAHAKYHPREKDARMKEPPNPPEVPQSAANAVK